MRFCLFALLLLSVAHGAYIYGDIYAAEGMQKLNGTVLKIKGESFSYYLVSEKSNYSLQLPDGRYDITAEYYDEEGNLLYTASENLYLAGEDVQLDLVLTHPDSDNMLFLLVVGILLMAAILFSLSRHASKAPEKWKEPEAKEPDAEAKEVLRALEAHEGRMTQKELKELLNYSDSKMSLVLAELEHEGLVKRFKRGRGNIIKKI